MFWSLVFFISKIVGFLSLATYGLTLLIQSCVGFWEQNLKVKYQSQWALVTGGSSGIGYAIVQKLAQQGINVVIVAFPDRLLGEKMATLKLQYPNLSFRSIGVDLSSSDAMNLIKKETDDLKINLIFNNAGYIKPGLFCNLPLDTLMSNYHTNATITISITHHFLNRMMDRQEKGLICFTGSSGGFIPGPMSSIYSSTKAWMTNFAASLAAETAENKIDILCVHPSPIASNFYNNASNMSALQFVKKYAASPEIIASTVFKYAGKTTIVDQGLVSIMFKLILKMLDWNLLTEIMVQALRYNEDYLNFKKLQESVKKDSSILKLRLGIADLGIVAVLGTIVDSLFTSDLISNGWGCSLGIISTLMGLCLGDLIGIYKRILSSPYKTTKRQHHLYHFGQSLFDHAFTSLALIFSTPSRSLFVIGSGIIMGGGYFFFKKRQKL